MTTTMKKTKKKTRKPKSIITPREVSAVVLLLAEGISQPQTAMQTGLGTCTVARIGIAFRVVVGEDSFKRVKKEHVTTSNCALALELMHVLGANISIDRCKKTWTESKEKIREIAETWNEDSEEPFLPFFEEEQRSEPEPEPEPEPETYNDWLTIKDKMEQVIEKKAQERVLEILNSMLQDQ